MPKKKLTTDKQVDRQVKIIENKNQLIDLENFYVNGKLDNLEELCELKKKELVTKLQEYDQLMTVEDYNSSGELVGTHRKPFNPYLISTYFFKSVNPLSNIEPEYSSEKLSIIWNLYMYLIEQVNINIGVIQPTISHFCKFAGISVNKFKQLKNNGSFEMQTLINKICDETFDSNVFLAQNKLLSNRSTELRVKVENEVQEKPQVHVNVNVKEEVNFDQIASRLNEISKFKTNKKKMQQPIEVHLDGE